MTEGAALGAQEAIPVLRCGHRVGPQPLAVPTGVRDEVVTLPEAQEAPGHEGPRAMLDDSARRVGLIFLASHDPCPRFEPLSVAARVRPASIGQVGVCWIAARG